MRTLFIWLLLTSITLAHTTVRETKLFTHMGEEVPRFASLPGNHLIVSEGETVTLSDSVEYDAIEIAGTLRVNRKANLTLRLNHLTVLPGGTFDCGTHDDPVTGDVDIVIRDSLLDTGTAQSPDTDPFQFGQAILVFGSWYSCGRPMDRTWMQTTGSLAEGQKEIELEQEPVGWSVGDRVTLPDTRQMSLGRDPVRPRREDGLQIESIDGNTISLTKGLAVAREAWTNIDGDIVDLPYIANMSRNVVIHSENPEGTRGHTAVFSQAVADVRYTSFIDLGRTRADVLHNTKADVNGDVTQIGTNQVARYPFHFHHAHGAETPSQVIGTFVDGTDQAKWGIVIHGTHDTVCRDNVGRRCIGSIIAVEDGYEVRNQITRNYCVESNGVDDQGHANALVMRNNPGAEGTGIWMHGSRNIVSDNVCLNNRIGMGVVHTGSMTSMAPAAPGEMPSEEVVGEKTTPIEFADNVCANNQTTGLELWNANYWENDSLLCYGNGGRGVWPGSGGGASSGVTLRNTELYRSDGRNVGVDTSLGYTSAFAVHGGRIEGFETGVKDTGATGDAIHSLKDLVLINRINIDWSAYQREQYGRPVFSGGPHAEIINVRCRAWGDNLRHIVLGKGYMYEPGQGFKSRAWLGNDGQSRITIRDWQGEEGNDLALFFHYQSADALAFHTSHPLNGGVPEKGLTMQEAWEKYGMAYSGSVACAEHSDVEGVFGLACPLEESVSKLGPPKAVLLQPAVHTPVEEDATKVEMQFVLTGDHSRADRYVYWSVDGEQMERLGPQRGMDFENRRSDRSISTMPGVHKVRTWREKNGLEVSGSSLEFTYTVGTQEPGDPVEPEPELEEQIDPDPESEPPEDHVDELEQRIAELEALVESQQMTIRDLKVKITNATKALR